MTWFVIPRLLSAGLLLALLAPCATRADVISMNSTAISAFGVNTSARGQALEDPLNSMVFGPLGMEFEVAAPTGGTSAVDDLGFEGPGLTIIGGSGFILRWLNMPVDPVRIGFSSFKDDDDRSAHAFDFLADYLRDQSQTSQSANGKVIGNPDVSLAIDSATGTVTPQQDLNLTVGGGPISSVWVRTNRFLTSWLDVEFTVVPEPHTVAIMTIGGAAIFLRRPRHTL